MPIYPYSFQLPPLNVQDIPNDGAVGEFLGISAGGVLDWLPVASGGGDLLAANNLSELTATAGTARTNLGLGTTDSPTFKNLTISTGTITTSAPVTISQTWGAVGQTFKALVVNAAGTSAANSASGSLLLDLQVGGVSKFSVDKAGVTKINNGGTLTWTSADSLVISSTSAYQRVLAYSFYDTGLGAGIGDVISSNGCRLYLGSGSGLGWFSNSTIGSGGVDTVLIRDGAANTLALRNSTAAQTFNVYGTYTSGSVYERMFARYDGTALAFQVGTQHVGASARPLQLLTDNTARMTIGTTGNVGIGTTAPTSNLEVVGTTSVSIAVRSGTNTFDGSYIVGTGQYESVYDARVSGNASGSRVIRFGNVNGGNFTFRALADTGETVLRTPISFSNAAPTGSLYILSSGNVGIGTTAPSSKLHVVGDAVLTGDLLGTNYTIGVPTILTQSNISITNTHSGVADSAIVITPKGTGGVIFGPKPDGTATGGNARGARAIDHQVSRNAAAQVASGTDALICGGNNNTASNQLSIVVGGASNASTGYISFIGGGQLNTASSNHTSVAGGFGNIASSLGAVVSGGSSSTASGSYSFIGGGIQALANRYGLAAHAAGQFSAQGDAQSSRAVFRNKTTTNSAVELFLDGVSERYTVTSGKVISMLINITGTKSDGSAVAHYVRQYSIKNVGGTTSQVYAPVTIGTDNAAGTSIAISANDTNDSLKIEVTGVTSETWRWVASVDAVEVGYGV
jgi:hypothetical protein